MPKKSTNQFKNQNAPLPAFEIGTGNVFADIGLPDADTALAKADLALEIARRVRALGINQTAVALRLGIDQPRVSSLLRGRLAAFSLEKLMSFVTKLGTSIDVCLVPALSASRSAIKVKRHDSTCDVINTGVYAEFRATSDMFIVGRDDFAFGPEAWLASKLSEESTEVYQI